MNPVNCFRTSYSGPTYNTNAIVGSTCIALSDSLTDFELCAVQKMSCNIACAVLVRRSNGRVHVYPAIIRTGR